MYGRELTSPAGCWERPEGRTDNPERSLDEVEKLRDRLQVAHETARIQAEKSWARRTKYCNKTRNPREFQPGDWVYLHIPAIKPGHSQKFHCPWTGPHRIRKALSRVTYELTLATGGTVVVHINRIKRAVIEGKTMPEKGYRLKEEVSGFSADPVEDEEEIIGLGDPYSSEDEGEETNDDESVEGAASETLKPEEDTDSSDSVQDTTLIGFPESPEKVSPGKDLNATDSPEKDSPIVGRRDEPRPLERAREVFLEGRRLSRERQRAENREYATSSELSSSPSLSDSSQDPVWHPSRPFEKPRPRSPYSLRSRHKVNSPGCSRYGADGADGGGEENPHG